MEYVTPQGVEIPALGFGTARMDTDEARRRALDAAIAAGYRHLDTAQSYGSERAVGAAVREADAPREEFFLTTKLAGENRAHDAVLDSVRESLDELDTDYVDLLLIHSPNDDVPHEETLAAMNEARDDGLVRHLGVSNFSVGELDAAVESSDAPVVTNQVEYHVRNRQDEVLTACLDADVALTAYSPLGVGDLLVDETLVEVGERHGKTSAQVALRWLLQQPLVATIPMSSAPEHVRENFAVFDFELTAEEMRDLFALEGAPDAALAERLGL